MKKKLDSDNGHLICNIDCDKSWNCAYYSDHMNLDEEDDRHLTYPTVEKRTFVNYDLDKYYKYYCLSYYDKKYEEEEDDD